MGPGAHRIRSGLGIRELIVSVIVLGVIGLVVSLNFIQLNVESDSRVQRAQLAAIHEAVMAFHKDLGRYPGSHEGLEVLWNGTAVAQDWRGPYLDPPIRADRWGRRLIYRPPRSAGEAIVLESLGADGRPGTADDISF